MSAQQDLLLTHRDECKTPPGNYKVTAQIGENISGKK